MNPKEIVNPYSHNIYIYIYMIYVGRESDIEIFSVAVDTAKTVNMAL